MTFMRVAERLFDSLGLVVCRKRKGYGYVERCPAGLRTRPCETDDLLTFEELSHRIRSEGRLLLDADRLYVIWQVLRNIRLLDGAFAEIGVYKGGSARFAAEASRCLAVHHDKFYVMDTFEGHPDCIVDGVDDTRNHKVGHFGDTSFSSVAEYLKDYSEIQVVEGDCQQTTDALCSLAYSYVHIDVDLYQPILHCLDYFGSRLVKGGVIVVDDYGAQKCPGVGKAVSKYLDNHVDFQQWFLFTEQTLLVKR